MDEISKKLDERTERSEDGCWNFTGSVGKKGGVLYDRSSGKRKSLLAHRVAWERDNGPIPEGKTVFQTCGNKACVRPDHLRCVAFGDHPGMERARVKRQHKGRISLYDALRIRKLYDEGLPVEKLAGRYRISVTYVRKIIRGERRVEKKMKLAG